jgi:hypothetical protein
VAGLHPAHHSQGTELLLGEGSELEYRVGANVYALLLSFTFLPVDDGGPPARGSQALLAWARRVRSGATGLRGISRTGRECNSNVGSFRRHGPLLNSRRLESMGRGEVKLAEVQFPGGRPTTYGYPAAPASHLARDRALADSVGLSVLALCQFMPRQPRKGALGIGAALLAVVVGLGFGMHVAPWTSFGTHHSPLPSSPSIPLYSTGGSSGTITCMGTPGQIICENSQGEVICIAPWPWSGSTWPPGCPPPPTGTVPLP